MAAFHDQTGREILLSKTPQRIVSLVPSQTELLHYLGLDEAVVGITKFCVHPQQWHQTKKRIGGTKNINTALIKSLTPDLIIAGKEENVKDQIKGLWDIIPVWTSDVGNLNDALHMIQSIGAITGTEAKAATLAAEISNRFAALPQKQNSLRTSYLIWREPYMTIGGDTFIHDMLQHAGFENVFATELRYPTISIEQLQAAAPDVILLSSEPYPFNQKHLEELKQHLPGTQMSLVDGELFSWYGSRLLHTPDYFKTLSAVAGA